MTAIYYHFLRFLADVEARRQINQLVKNSSCGYVKFRYSQGCLSLRTSLVDLTSAGLHMIEEEAEKLSVQIQRVLAEKQSTFDRLHRERYCSEDAL